MKIKSFIRFFQRSIFLLSCILIPLLLLLLLLPTLVSTPPVISRLQIAIGSTLGRTISINDLQWSWLKGITISDLQIAEDPRFGDQPLLRLGKLQISYNLSKLLSKTFIIEVKVSGLTGRMITDSEGRNNIDSLLEALAVTSQADKEKESAEAQGSLTLPLDIQAWVLLDDISFELKDERQNRHLSVEDLSLHLEMPSLLHQPVELDLNAPLIRLNENTLEPISFHLFLADLFQNDKKATPLNSRVMINGRLPGIGIDLQGGPLAKGVTGKVGIDLAAVFSSFKPLLPPDLPEVSGEINMDLTGSFDQTNSPPLDLDLLLSGKAITVQPLPPNIPRLNTDFLITLTADGNLDELLAADLDIEVKDLTGSGAPLPDSGVGPINLAFQENFFFERAQDQLRIEDGRIQIGKKSFLDWRAELSDLQSAQAVQLTLDELHLDLDEIAALAEPWIPRFITFDRDLGTGIIGITGLHFKGNATGGPAEFDLENLRIVLSGLHIQLEQLDIKNKNIELQLENLNASLENNFPTAISLSLGASIDGFSMTGGQEIFFDNLELRDARLTANQLVLDTLSPYGIKGLLIGEQQLRLNGFELPGQLSIPEFTENISLEARLGESGDASLTVHELTTRVPSVTLMGLPTPNGDKNGSLTTSLAADLQLERINVQQGELPKTEAKGLAAELRLGEMLKFNLHGSMAELGTKELLADFGAQIDLREVSTMAGALLPPGFTAGGNVSIHGVSTGHIPLPAELQVLQNRELPPGIRFCDLSFAENYLFSVEFKDIDLDLPISDDRQIQVRNCHTATPLTLQLKGADKRLTLGGRMELPEIRQLPPAEDIPENMALSLKFSGTTAEFNYFEMGEELEIQPIGLKQAFTLRLAKMDSLLDGKLPISPALILQQIDLDLNNHLSFNRRSDARPLSSAISLGGGLDIDMNLKLRGGESTAFDLSLGADGLYFAMRDKLELNGLDADFQLGKSYRLDLTPKEEQPRPQPPLSLGVLVATGNMGLTGATPATFTERFRQDAKQTQPSFAFKSFRLMGDAPRIELTDSTLNFKLVDSLPVIDNVELNILGGTVLCSLTTSEKDSSYALSLKVAFSGIDAERMLPDLLAELPSSETEISGLVEVETPLSSEPDQLLESLRVRLHISHIGQKMLSRLLYGLDPHESNEAIIKQRKLVELGSPRWIMVTVENGNLSLSGEVSVKGISIALPELKRVNLAGLPIETELRGALAGLADLEKGLNFLRADTLVIEEGKIAPLRR